MPFLLAIFIGLWASVANADFYTGVLQQQAQQVAAPPSLDCSTATCNETLISSLSELTAWEEATDIDLTSPCTIEVGTIDTDIALGTTQVTLTGATTNSTCYRVLRGSTQPVLPAGAASNIRVTCAQNFQSCIILNDGYNVLEKLDIDHTGTGTSRVAVTAYGNSVINQSIISAVGGEAVSLAASTGSILNSVIPSAVTGITMAGFSAHNLVNVLIANTTSRGMYLNNSAAPVLKNTVFYNATDDVVLVSAGGCAAASTNNATSQATVDTSCDAADGTWVTSVAAGDFVDAAGGDFTPDTATLLDQGADNVLSGFARADWPFGTDTINADLLGTDRGTVDWDVGAVEGN